MLCLSGDHQTFGNHPQAKNVYDIDSMQLISLVRKMRDEAKFMNDEDIDMPPALYQAASTPEIFPRIPVLSPAMKIQAAADLSNPVHLQYGEIQKLMKMAVDMGLHEKPTFWRASPMKSVGMAQYAAKSVPSMDVPPHKRPQGWEKERWLRRNPVRHRQTGSSRDERHRGIHLMAIE
jgi:methylenetetrahydrofolate reductase (NADPH)